MPDDDRSTLARIAALLRVPVVSFYEAPLFGTEAALSPAAQRIVATILMVVGTIPDPDERRQCLERALAELTGTRVPGDESNDDG